MQQPFLEVTFHKGRPLAAYLYLPRTPRDRSARTQLAAPGLVVDFNRTGKPIGVEITDPELVSLAALNRVLRKLGATAIKRTEFAPLRASAA